MARTVASSLISKLRRDGTLSDAELRELKRTVDTLERVRGTSHETSATHHGSGTHFTSETDHHTSHVNDIAVEIEGLEE